jgi:hypothetical protein
MIPEPAMTQTPADPSMPRGKRPSLEPQAPLQQTAMYPPPVPAAPKKVKRWPTAVGAGFLGLFIGVGLGANSPRADTPSTTRYITETVRAPASTFTVNAPAPAAAAAAPAGPSGPLTSFDDGTYEVGTGEGQVAPGKYTSPGPEGGGVCYSGRLKHNDGELGDIIDNDISQGQAILVVKPSDGYVKVSGCTFTKTG